MTSREELGPKILGWSQEAVRFALEAKGARSRLVTAAGRAVHYLDVPGSGPGPTLVLAHGLGGSSMGWMRVLFRLAKGVRRVVAPDMPGSGFSPLPADGPLGFEGMMQTLEAFASQEVPERAVYVGNSLGGAQVARLAANHPEKVKGLVLVAPGGGQVSPDKLRALIEGFQVKTHRDARVLARRFFARPPLLLPFLMTPGLLPAMRRPAVRKLLDDVLRVSSLAPEELGRLTGPALVLWARNERLLPYESLEHFRRYLPRSAEIEEVDDFGHSPHLDRPQPLVDRVLRFVRERVGP